MHRLAILAAAVACSARFAPDQSTLAMPHKGNPQGSFVLVAKKIYTGSAGPAWVLSPGVIVVRDGKIVAIGTDVADAPADLPVVHLRDAIVTPGLVAAATSFVSPHTGDESIAAGYRAIDAFDPYGDYQEALAGGVTTIHLDPGGHRLLTGQGAVVRLGGPQSAGVLREQADLTINFGEQAFRPPPSVKFQTPASSDVAIPPAIRQRPDSRLGQFAALREAIEAAESAKTRNFHQSALADAWEKNAPLRIQVQRGADMAGALRFLNDHRADRSAAGAPRRGYIVGGAQADVVRARLAEAGVPLVFTIASGFRSIPGDIGFDPDALEADTRALSTLHGIPIALAGPLEPARPSDRDTFAGPRPRRGGPGMESPDSDTGGSGESLADLRLAAATALRAGLTERQVIEGITRVPAEILGVADRVGSLAPGLDADLAVFSDDPFSTGSHAMLVYVAGNVAFEAPGAGALVVRAGTVWVDETTQITNGAVLVEDGRIAAVGRTVPHPPFARVIDAGPGGFVAPGLIDAFGHLGFEGDRAATDPDLSPAVMIGVPDVAEKRVARAGVTTVMTSSYAASGQGSQIAAIRTWGAGRDDRVVRETAGVHFDFRSADPIDVGERLDRRLKAGKEYLEKWLKYEKEFAEWKVKKASGELDEMEKKPETVQVVEKKGDPITGTWEATLSGGPIPEPQTATMKLRLTGSDVEGRISIPGQPGEQKVTGTFDGKRLSAKLDVETPFGPPTIEAELVEEDYLKGKVAVADIQIDFEARRTDKSDVEFKVTRSRTHGKDGRPLPPPIDEGLEPLRAVLQRKIPISVTVLTEAQIAEILKIAEQYDVHLVLRDADGAAAHAEALADRSAGVVVGKQIVTRTEDEGRRVWYHQSDDLSRKGVSIAFQSDAEDGARALPWIGLHAVERGLSADAALAAFTTQPSRMFKLDEEIGSLHPGRLGDLVIFNGHPFLPGSGIERVIINGVEVE